jgi:hypothetical protein
MEIKNRGKMKMVWVILVLTLAVAGCTTKSKSQMQAREAYLEGQNAALKQLQATGAGVTVIGAVQTPFVPWVAGLTLAQAIATANYVGTDEPKQIIITRKGESATLDAKVLLNGTDLPLEVGDVIELR